MEIGIIGLGRMGGNIARRLMKSGHRCVVFDRNAAPREQLARDGATAAGSLEDMVEALNEKPRAVWVMLPAGQVTEQTVERLGNFLEANDIVIDGGNSYYKDDIRRAKRLAEKRIRYVDCGTSGGVWGLERGYCMMIGGPKEAVDHLDPIFAALAPGLGNIARTPVTADHRGCHQLQTRALRPVPGNGSGSHVTQLADAEHHARAGHLPGFQGEVPWAADGSRRRPDGLPLRRLVSQGAECRLRDAALRCHDRRPDEVHAR